ncbi:SDR family NAD(P)-dependent oxidoreductase [Shewanella sp. 202IG2-18]|uniref:SDR family NAD(P)-dependent oxidoreductase n=1 Tax=Parashewanella hymeniacidonis TaxID=2807618 RepID=UPI0019607413|nr:SDR family NAD(P)-dependent oxidoreductase [Parashewanella hymeniacidonis]MBM7074355.1 SDR family NAD(P)-dependent oxidoreductase [Parashewanella hymeniacidonis]
MKKVMITGATSGIGEALVELYYQTGFSVIACGRNKGKLLQLKKRFSAIQCLQFDVTQPEEVMQAAADVSKVDILLLNAGDCRYIDNAYHFDAAAFKHNISTNLLSMGDLLSSFLPKMDAGSRLVFISSIATQLPFPQAEAYGASKAGLDYLANSLRLDLKSVGVDVTLVHPGFVKTPLTDKNNFFMPFIVDTQTAAKRIYQGVQSRKNYVHFPRRFTYLLKLISLVPNSWWQRIITKKL